MLGPAGGRRGHATHRGLRSHPARCPCSYARPSHPPSLPPSSPARQDVLRTVPERNPAGRLEDLSGEGGGAGGAGAAEVIGAAVCLFGGQPGLPALSRGVVQTPSLPAPSSPHPHPHPPTRPRPRPQCTSASSACCTWPTSTAWSSAPCPSWTACSSQMCPRASPSERQSAQAARRCSPHRLQQPWLRLQAAAAAANRTVAGAGHQRAAWRPLAAPAAAAAATPSMIDSPPV